MPDPLAGAYRVAVASSAVSGISNDAVEGSSMPSAVAPFVAELDDTQGAFADRRRTCRRL
ncbi:hypothetical protein GCM10011579_066620 [Streptomyces albiflavescens]|uniref:Uncharacterized protein n=1 Tax=Streptomyces albiflavescens TaxID=1623582 RepID=A0A917YBL4_9ACTN|nr:hypothetical protein GCM10011579_066620 [Streptomyces albiflavescens]